TLPTKSSPETSSRAGLPLFAATDAVWLEDAERPETLTGWAGLATLCCGAGALADHSPINPLAIATPATVAVATIIRQLFCFAPLRRALRPGSFDVVSSRVFGASEGSGPKPVSGAWLSVSTTSARRAALS